MRSGRIGQPFLFPFPNGTSTNVVNQGRLSASGAGVFLALNPTVNAANSGTIEATSSATVDIGGFQTTRFMNTGVVRAESGGRVLILDQTVISNLISGTLTGGSWRVGPGGLIDFQLATARVMVNAADIQLSGLNSNFPDLAPLHNNRGSFSLSGGRTFQTVQGFENVGLLSVGLTSRLDVFESLLLSPASVIALEVSAGDSFGQILAAQAATLAGTLRITSIGAPDYALWD